MSSVHNKSKWILSHGLTLFFHHNRQQQHSFRPTLTWASHPKLIKFPCIILRRAFSPSQLPSTTSCRCSTWYICSSYLRPNHRTTAHWFPVHDHSASSEGEGRGSFKNSILTSSFVINHHDWQLGLKREPQRGLPATVPTRNSLDVTHKDIKSITSHTSTDMKTHSRRKRGPRPLEYLLMSHPVTLFLKLDYLDINHARDTDCGIVGNTSFRPLETHFVLEVQTLSSRKIISKTILGSAIDIEGCYR